MVKYDRVACNRFVVDMERFGLEASHYKGRNHWEGPAVTVDRRRLDALRDATAVKILEEPLGAGFVIVHPVVPGRKKGD